LHELLVVAGVTGGALIASTIAAIAGYGGAAIMLPILLWAFGVRDAIPILTVAQLLGNLSRVWFNRGELDIAVVRWFALGAVPAAVLGGVLFATAPATALVRVLGVFLLLMVAYRRSRRGAATRIGLRGFPVLGATSGFVSALVGSVGPFMAPFFLAYGLVKGAYIGTEALATVTMHVVKLGVYGGYSLLGPFTIVIGLAIGAVMFLGSYLGKRLLDRLPEHLFPYFIEGVLLFAGLLFIIRG